LSQFLTVGAAILGQDIGAEPGGRAAFVLVGVPVCLIRAHSELNSQLLPAQSLPCVEFEDAPLLFGEAGSDDVEDPINIGQSLPACLIARVVFVVQ
jgi:hypothetical protein